MQRLKTGFILKILTTIFLTAVMAFPQHSQAKPQQITGRAVVHDGDTIRIGDARIRIWGIDAPELTQICTQNGKVVECGVIAGNALRTIINGQALICSKKGMSYNRVVAICTVNGRDIAAEMTRLGMAFDYKKYSGGAYDNQEKSAQDIQAGIWNMQIQTPEDWRKCNKGPKKNREKLSCGMKLQ
jgi:endonuclease YncB( thermonuclease family)